MGDIRGDISGDIHRREFLALVAAGAVASAAVFAAPPSAYASTAPRAASALRVTRRSDGAGLLVGGKRRRLSGANAYWLGLNDNKRDVNGNPTFPTHAELTAALVGLRHIGASLVRSHTIGISAGTPRSFETAPGVFADRNLNSADWAIYQANKNNILLMVPLTDQWNNYHGGKGVFVHWARRQNGNGIVDVPAPAHLFDADSAEKGSTTEDQFYATGAGGMRIRALFKDYIKHWLNHVNPYTGLAYKDDPTIAIVETGNEIYSATAEWTEDIAAFIKKIAPAKLVADGSAATGLAVSDAPGLNAAHVDIVGAHYYAHDDSWNPAPLMTMADQLAADASAARRAGKAFIIGEYPWTRADAAQWYTALERNSTIAADMNWGFIGANEQHGGGFGGDDFPVHWPYRGANEKKHAPALARHIKAVTANR